MRIGIIPVIDCVFKRLFGSEENKALLLSLVNAILEEGGEERVLELEILNPYNPKTFLQDKLTIVDVKAKSASGEWFILEVQIDVAGYFPQRLLYYWARTYQSQLKESEKYYTLKKVTLICITKEDLPIVTTRYYNHFQVLEVKDKIVLCEGLHIHTIELSKFLAALKDISKPIEQWSYFLKHGENLDDESLPTPLATPTIQHAIKELKMFTQDEMERDLYESRRKAAMDQISLLAYKEEVALKKGEEIGLKKGEEIGLKKGREEAVVKALNLGLDLETIHKITGVAREEIERIKKNL